MHKARTIDPPAHKGPSLILDRVGLVLGGARILHGISFRVEPGEVHCIIGPNGGGKTSLVRSVLGLMPHTGAINIRWGKGRTLGYVPQSLEIDDTLPLNVENFMAMVCGRRPAFLGLGGKWRKAASAALERVGMDGKLKRPFGGLSGGERRRVLLAQALIPRPSLLILDEPDTGLDSSGSSILLSLIRELKDEGTTILIIHHDLGVVCEIGDAVTCISRTVLFSGTPEEEITPERMLGIYTPVKAA